MRSYMDDQPDHEADRSAFYAAGIAIGACLGGGFLLGAGVMALAAAIAGWWGGCKA